MTDTLLAAALTGTAHRPDPPRRTGTPVDALVDAMPASTVERDILLSAGAMAIYRRAGCRGSKTIARPPVCPPETCAELDGPGADLVGDLLDGRQPMPRWTDPAAGRHARLSVSDLHSLLPELFVLIERRGCRLPHRLLPRALSLTSAETRAALLPILGERGRWLARFDPAWHWAVPLPGAENGGLPANAETMWQDGTLHERRSMLERLRVRDADMARAWLAATWKGEKAEARLALLGTFEQGLTTGDEPFLEQALHDRGERVRDLAADLLLRLPDSALKRRLVAVADACLSYNLPAGRLQGLARMLGESRHRGDLDVHLQPAGSIDWPGIGIMAQPPEASDHGRDAWYLARVLSAVPPAHWCGRFAATPGDLVDAATASPWRLAVLEGWSNAAARFGDDAWIMRLWQWWSKLCASGDSQKLLEGIGDVLFAALPSAEAEAEIVRLFGQGDLASTGMAVEKLGRLQHRWGAAASMAYVDMLVFLVRGLPQAVNLPGEPGLAAVLQSMPLAARRLSPACFDRVPQAWALPDDRLLYQWRPALDTLAEIIHLRCYIRRTLGP